MIKASHHETWYKQAQEMRHSTRIVTEVIFLVNPKLALQATFLPCKPCPLHGKTPSFSREPFGHVLLVPESYKNGLQNALKHLAKDSGKFYVNVRDSIFHYEPHASFD
jgi:hypothetical protein